jgi:hypothetical protein
VKFVIIAPARSGSTLLREMLNRHPAICCHGEVYGVHRVLGHSMHAIQALEPEQALKLRRRDPVAFLDEHVFSSQRPVVGFKLLYGQLLNLDFAPVLHRLIDEPDLHVIHLWRRNLVARHVSEARLRMKVAARKPGGAPAEFLEHALRPALVERSCRVNIAARACARRLFDRHPSLQIDYEDYIGAQDSQSTRLCDFLGVDRAGWSPLPAKAAEAEDADIERLLGMPALQVWRDQA